ncbi:hypothetical protein NDU88_006263 [Pleurodeles waltl]|uniref:Uncharacterized protein n=1 Tax=Pleurodeles waltl TaxID=8319 RepID=A0AAV7SP94_PLEWA|nr:hypothetical protein NDU88_006263 [Pleurodeles waltl]
MKEVCGVEERMMTEYWSGVEHGAEGRLETTRGGQRSRRTTVGPVWWLQCGAGARQQAAHMATAPQEMTGPIEDEEDGRSFAPGRGAVNQAAMALDQRCGLRQVELRVTNGNIWRAVASEYIIGIY